MTNFQSRNRIKKILGAPGLTVILVLALVFLFESGYSIFVKKQDTASRHELVASALLNMESERDFLRAEINYMSTDRGKEEEVRKKFGVAEEGESLTVIVDSEDTDEAPVYSAEEESLWTKIVDFFR